MLPFVVIGSVFADFRRQIVRCPDTSTSQFYSAKKKIHIKI